MAVYGYARCSTNEARQDIERQVRELEALGAVEVFREYESGAKNNRKVFETLFKSLKPGDTLVSTEVSRLTRSLHKLCHLYEEAAHRKLKLVMGNLTFDFTSGRIEPFPLAMLQIIGVFAELERNIDIERISSGLIHARNNGVKFGRPKKTVDELSEEVKALWLEYKFGKINKSEFAVRAKVSRPTVSKYIKLLEGL